MECLLKYQDELSRYQNKHSENGYTINVLPLSYHYQLMRRRPGIIPHDYSSEYQDELSRYQKRTFRKWIPNKITSSVVSLSAYKKKTSHYTS